MSPWCYAYGSNYKPTLHVDRNAKMITDICGKFHTCQLTKRKENKYGKLPAKIAEVDPWKTLCVDLIGPYRCNQKGNKPVQLWEVTMIYPETGWF